MLGIGELHHVIITQIVLSARVGATAGEAFQDALRVAVMQWENVTLFHKGTRYQINIHHLVAAIRKEDGAPDGND